MQVPDAVAQALHVEDAVLMQQWERLQAWFEERFGREPGIEAILFLIGIQSRGRGYEYKLKKEAKQDLIMEGTYCAFETLGLYHRIGADADGHWIWEPLGPPLPKLSIEDQEKLLRVAILQYFDEIL